MISKRDNYYPLATMFLNFDRVILKRESTKRLLGEKSISKDLESILIREIVKNVGIKPGSLSYPRRYYGFLFCELVGLDLSNLLLIIGADASKIDVVLATLYGGYEIKPEDLELKKFRNPYKSLLERLRKEE